MLLFLCLQQTPSFLFLNLLLCYLQTIVPSSLQLSAMAVQMLVINPVLSLLSALVTKDALVLSFYYYELFINVG